MEWDITRNGDRAALQKDPCQRKIPNSLITAYAAAAAGSGGVDCFHEKKVRMLNLPSNG
jgi:hypothetical protein